MVGANPEAVETDCVRPVDGVARVWGDPAKISVDGLAAGVNGSGLARRVYPPPDAPIGPVLAGGGRNGDCRCIIERMDWIPVSIPLILPLKVSRRRFVAAMSARSCITSPMIIDGAAA